MELFSNIWESFSSSVLSLLPLSPFRQYLDYFSAWEYIGVLNWFFPFRECLTVLTAWGISIGLYYGYSVLMRWLKLIGS